MINMLDFPRRNGGFTWEKIWTWRIYQGKMLDFPGKNGGFSWESGGFTCFAAWHCGACLVEFWALRGTMISKVVSKTGVTRLRSTSTRTQGASMLTPGCVSSLSLSASACTMGWRNLVGSLNPSEKMMEFVNGVRIIPCMENHPTVWNHQPEQYFEVPALRWVKLCGFVSHAIGLWPLVSRGIQSCYFRR